MTLDKKGKKILYIDYLDFISLFLAFIMKPFFHKVYFHNAINIYQSKGVVNNLKLLGIHWLSFNKIPFHIWCRSFKELNPYLADTVLHKLIHKSKLYSLIIKYFKLNKRGVIIFDSTIKNFITHKWMEEGTTSFALMEYYFKNLDYNITYIPSTPGNHLMSLYLSERYNPISIYLLLNLLWTAIVIFYKSIFAVIIYIKTYIINILYKSSAKTNYSNLSCADYEVGFVPHRGLKYGKFFNKTYLYEDDINSIFFKNKLLTLKFNNDSDPVSDRFYRLHKIPYYNISKPIIYLSIAIYNLIKILIRKTPYIVKPLDIIQTILLSHIFILVYIYNKQLCRFSKLKLIYFHNDILVSDTFVIACHINNIATISHQERPHSSVWSNLLIFNHYFICGPKFKKIYSDRGNCIEYYHNIGLFRSSYIKNAVKKSKYEQLYDGSKYKHLLVCFDTLPLGYFDAGLYGNDVSEDSVKEFYDVLYKLSITLKDVFILIKPKNIRIFKNNTFSSYLNLKSNNFKIITDLKKYNPYEMASIADIVIGRYTSILDEAFSAGKKVIYYDNDDLIKITNYVINDTDYVVSNGIELEKKVRDIIFNDRYSSEEKIQNIKNRFFYSENGVSGLPLLKRQISNIHSLSEET